MDKFRSLKSKIAIFVKDNFIVVIVACLVFIIFIPIIIFSNFLSSKPTTTQPTPSLPVQITTAPATNVQQTLTPTPSIDVSKYVYQQKTWKEAGHTITFDPVNSESPYVKKILSDGSILYSFDSLNPNRPDIIITENGSVIFARSTFVGGKDVNDGYKNLFGKQSHTLPGPTFYGADTVIYYYEDGGTALTVDPKTGWTYEEFTFQPPISVEEFKQKYRQYAN